jgi:hypothetical protein
MGTSILTNSSVDHAHQDLFHVEKSIVFLINAILYVNLERFLMVMNVRIAQKAHTPTLNKKPAPFAKKENSVMR